MLKRTTADRATRGGLNDPRWKRKQRHTTKGRRCNYLQLILRPLTKENWTSSYAVGLAPVRATIREVDAAEVIDNMSLQSDTTANYIDDLQFIPEPSAWLLMELCGLAAMAIGKRAT